ncbi:MAG: DUF2156 domain-containing protein [Cypionkella sp.]|nr:DUF2156 domain-containing protein [Cypionkella sp.]
MRGAAVPAEIGLMAQGQHQILARCVGAGAPLAQMISVRGHVTVGLLDPICAPKLGPRRSAVTLLEAAAQASGTWPALYKVGAGMAAAARAKGWRCARISREGVIDLREYDLAAPARAGLRRKLRRAETAGVRVQLAQNSALPLAEMAALCAEWARAHGGERGFSMGQFDPDYIAQQRIYVARIHGRLAGFVTLHSGLGLGGPAQEWTLDLMRHGADLPDGAMHALVHLAIMDAQRCGISRLSLAAVPEAAFGAHHGRLAAALARILGLDAGRGLRRFKDAFAPDWQPRYLCAPHMAALVVAAASIWRAVVRGAPCAKTAAKPAPCAHNRFALRAGIWQGRA